MDSKSEETAIAPRRSDNFSRRKLLVMRLVFQALPRLLGRSDRSTLLLLLTPGSSTKNVVGRGDDLCVEARHRSANTFASVAFEIANPELKLASHTHQPGNALRALRLGVPCLVIVRDPIDQGVSWREFSAVHQPAGRILRDYIRFYEKVVPRVEPGRLAICTFEDITSSPQAITRIANAALSCDFEHCEYEQAEVRRLATRRRQYDVVGRLSAAEREEVERELRDHRLYPRAVRAHRAACEVAVSPPAVDRQPQVRAGEVRLRRVAAG